MSDEIVGKHPVAVLMPVLAEALKDTLNNVQSVGTSKNYRSATKQWEEFCVNMRATPYPAEPITLAAWMVHMAVFKVKITSLKAYLSALSDAHLKRGFPWEESYSIHPRLVFKSLKRKYGYENYRLKVPITLTLIQVMGRHLKGWPIPELMSHDDRLFTLASLIGVLGFLRGGEFLTSPGSGRPMLKMSQMRLQRIHDRELIELTIEAPKARPWEGVATIRIFGTPQFSILDPVRWFKAYVGLSPMKLHGKGAALIRKGNKTLDKAYMLKRTNNLLAAAGVVYQDVDGRPVKTKAASWRAGGVQTATTAGLGEDMIRQCGRWKSSAWLNYGTATSLLRIRTVLCSLCRALWLLLWRGSTAAPKLQE